MPPEVHWPAIALRLTLTIIAGGLLGAERSKSGHAAGLRTTLLVTLAASVAMIQMNLLLPTNGKPHDSYAVMDLMRLPLGILTGVGFIGAGAIVRKGEMVAGVTTASTIWFSTVVGLCLGGGQVVLGSVSTVLGLGVLWGLRSVEGHVERDQSATLKIAIAGDGVSVDEVRARVLAARYRINSLAVIDCLPEQRRSIECELRWPSAKGGGEIPPIVAELERLPGVIELKWRGVGTGPS